ncbi:hypothetical protein CLV36_107102 [Laceyella sediminis]|uniref:Uncharacterized protein n=1 Tax=Laceyella sediminis TaxID=573074 RepID=A0ABX5EP52_9BACL|nr:hypothetical protein [Laceyella sediminis]PRZ13907.1 hypothetical protein CLV36_107102 [Laceyella sediminis]
MKRLISILTPFLVIGFIMYILIDFRRVEVLSAEEKQAIDRYRQELVKGTLLNKNQNDGVFLKQDFDQIATSLELLHEHSHYHVFGPEWGERLANPAREFNKIQAILNKPMYKGDTAHQAFLQSLQADLTESRKQIGKRLGHDILDDLATLVFTNEITEERQWSNAKTIQVMKDLGVKLIKEDAKSGVTPPGQQPAKAPAGTQSNQP